MNRRRTVVLAAAALVAVAAGALILTAPAVAATVCPRCYGFSALGDGIYVDRGDERYRRIVDRSKQRITAFYGTRVSHPRVLICTTEACYRRIGGGGEKGKAIRNWSVMLSPRGANETIATHELSHVEFHERLGAARREVPHWFDEGLAVLVSEDPRYLRPPSNPDRCRLPYEQAAPVIHTDWRRAVTGGVDRPYRQAACVVSRWTSARGGPAAVPHLITLLRAGADFDTVLALPLREVARPIPCP
jgi:hypothetical protein